ncbi:VPS10 domain-containing protein [Roseisolibacter agri]|uniref:VPS10 domain-containing protein n=1 Tax=Roseisolibacter agri TaxID=2014610 RepID=UPI0024E191BC|nr:glycosyl hydrolase [Roseisolibacter agri]
MPAALAVLLTALPAVPLPAVAQPPAPTRPAAGRGQLAVTPATPGSPADTALVQGLRWRNIGPFRGGRATAVAGHPAQPLTFYMGATGGGVWKTEDAGGSWRNVTDGHFAMGSVGSIAVAPSDPNVLYVGMGEAPVRGMSSSYGDGVYRSTDAGRTWTHLGLERTRTISQVIVHPRDENTVWVAAQGSRWGGTPDRGIYKSTDGGKTWRHVLAGPNATSGASDLSMDANNPRILFAAFWDHQRQPWYVRSGGPGSSLWRSADGGETWTRLSGNGLPSEMGKTAVAVSPANSERVWALIEGTADSGGLYRSDDAGKNWRLINGDRVLRARAWYYIHLFADPKNQETVYVMNAPFLKSTDGGRTFATIPTPHGDNHHLWINPQNPDVMINANDGGANVSLNGGRAWSTQENQPTAQFYRATLDERFPFWIYGGQQDNTSVAVMSRTTDVGVTEKDWFVTGGCESAFPGVDAKNPKIVYGGCYQGLIDAFDLETRSERGVMAYASLGLAMPSDQQKYRFNWSAPILVSRHDPKVIYHGGNVLLKTTDGGNAWTAISPDLTRNDRKKVGAGGGPYTNEGAGGEVYGTIFYVAESAQEPNVLWVTTDDGLVQVTRDGGASWQNVTPAGLGEGLANALDLSEHAKGTAYLAFTKYKFDDNRPYVLKTSDYGKTWSRIDAGLPELPVRVVREDPARAGLLYVGNESGVWMSHDDGRRWAPLQRNLPRVPVTDLRISTLGDLVAATEGRAYWILDDLSPLRQRADALRDASRPLLFAPRPAYRYAVDGGAPVPAGAARGQNAPGGATIDFVLAAKPDSARPVRVEIVGEGGTVLRRFPTPRDRMATGGPPGAAPGFAPVAGHNRLVWNLRTEGHRVIPGLVYDGPTTGWVVPPGSYTVRLLVGSDTLARPLEVRDDPRDASAGTVAERTAGHARRAEMNRAMAARVDEITSAVLQLRDVRDQVTKLAERAKAEDTTSAAARTALAALATRAADVAKRTSELEATLVQLKRRTQQDVVNFPPALLDHYLFVARTADATDPPMTRGLTDRAADLDVEWRTRREAIDALLARDVAELNRLAREGGVRAVVTPAPRPTTVM